jgi:hypothetical protein
MYFLLWGLHFVALAKACSCVAMNFPVHGFNECLIMYVLAASGEKYPVSDAVYHRGWVQSNFFKNGKTFYGYSLPLGFDYGGPLFFFAVFFLYLGLNPHGLKDEYAGYREQNKIEPVATQKTACFDLSENEIIITLQ